MSLQSCLPGWRRVELFEFTSLYFRWFVALLSLLRGLTGFRLFNGTRFYIELILRSLNDIKYFFVMFSYSTLTFGFLFMISRQRTLNFQNIWAENYDLNFGNYHDSESGSDVMNYIVYFGATVINVVLMLNLLISILGDSYERFQLDQVNIDIKEKAKNSRELQLMFFWTSRITDTKYIKICTNAFEVEDDQGWEGRMRFMDKKLEKLAPQIRAANKSLETKIASVETNIRSLDGKIEEILKILSKK